MLKHVLHQAPHHLDGNAKTTSLLGSANKPGSPEPNIHILGSYGVHIRVFVLPRLCRAQMFTRSHFDPLVCDIIVV